MPGFQPRITTDHVWYNGTDIHTYAIATGLGIRLTEIRGWDERPDVRDVREVRFQQHGEYADDVYLGGRTITVMGAIHGSSWVDLQARKRAFAALVQPTSDEVLFKIPDPATVAPTAVYSTTGMTGYERASVRPVEGIAFGDMIGACAMTFQIILRASDPRIYSDVETSTDSGTTGTASRTVVVDQAGTFETPVTLTVTGPTASTWTVSEPSSGLTIGTTTLDLIASETVTLTALERTVVYTSTYGAVRLQRGDVIAQWMLAETSGTTADNAQGTAAYDGTYTGTFALNQSGPASGIASVDLNGSSGYVTVTYAAALVPSESTIEGWVYFDSLSGTQTIFDAFDSNSGWYVGYESGTGSFHVTVGNGTTTTTAYGTSPAVSTWYHIAATVSTVTDTVYLYVNGAFAGSASLAGLSMPGAGAIQIGRGPTTSSYFNGKVSAFTLYSGALSAPTIAELYAASASTTSLNGYSYLTAATARWANLGTASSTYTLASTGLNTGSKLNVTYRDARL